MDHPARDWSEPPPATELADRLAGDGVHLWRSRIDLDDRALASLEPLLDADERARAARFRFARHRRAFTASHGFVRRVLAGYLGRPAAELGFRIEPEGKPHLAGADAGRLGFNLSHSGRWALLGVIRHGTLGVDVEEIRLPSPEDDVARRLFSPRELELWRPLSPPDHRTDLFFLTWAIKEACVKAIGRGLTYPIADLEVLFPDADGALRAAGTTFGDERRWWIHPFRVAPDHPAALALDRAPGEPATYTWKAASPD